MRFVVVASLVLACATAARAANNDAIPMGDLAAIAGGAVVAAGDDCGSVAYNPAGLVGIPRNSVSISASLFQLQVYQLPGYLQAETPNGRVRSGTTNSVFSTVPPAVIFARRWGTAFAYALSLTVPEAAIAATDKKNVIMTPETPELRESLRNLGASILYRGGATLAWAVSSRLRLGATFNVALVRASQLFSFELAMREQSGRWTFVSSETTVRATAAALGGIVGLQWAVSPRFALGVSLEPPLVGVFGSTEVDQSLFVARVMDGQAPMITDTPTAASNSNAGTSLGRLTLRVGVAYTPDWGWLSAQLDYRPQPIASLPWGEQSTSNVRVGAVRNVSSSLRIGAGAFTDFDTSPRTASFRFDYVGTSAGVTWRRRLELKTSTTTLALSTTFAARYAYGWGHSTVVLANPASEDLTQIVTTPIADGTIHEAALYIGSGVEY